MIRRSRPLLGTFVEIGVEPSINISTDSSVEINTEKNTPLNNTQVNQAINAAFNTIAQIDQQLTFHNPASLLSQINNAPKQWHSVSGHCFRVLQLAKAMGQASHNIFNVTVGGAVVKSGKLPQWVKHAFLTIGNSDDILLNQGRVSLKRPVLITLDGIAKGYAVDVAVATLKRHGVRSGWVNAGGDLRVFGHSVLAVHQRHANKQDTTRILSAPLPIKNTAIASSQCCTPTSLNNTQTVFPSIMILPKGCAEQTTNTPLTATNTTLTVSSPLAWRADALTKIAAAKHYTLVKQLKGSILNFLPIV